MNLVIALLVIGGGSAFVWSGITDPEGGTFAGLARLLRGEPESSAGDADGASLTATLAALASSPSGGKARTGGGGFVNAGAGSGSGGKYNLGRVQPHVAKAAGEVGSLFGIGTVHGFGQRANATDHDDGLALDFMVSGVRGRALAGYVLANGRRLRVDYVIYQQRINSRDGRGWRRMEDRGSPTANHMDHVHVSFHPSAGVSA